LTHDWTPRHAANDVVMTSSMSRYDVNRTSVTSIRETISSTCASYCSAFYKFRFHPVDPISAMHNKKLRYREEHSASVVLSWCTL